MRIKKKKNLPLFIILKIDDMADKFILSDMDRRLPFDNDTFTELVCIDGIEHIEKPFDFIRAK